jgi:glycosyltransferase involved in cell wall biosynthesis
VTAVRILVLPKWYPWPESPVFGTFCHEQARAAARHHDVVVLAFRPEPMGGLRVFRTWEDAAEEPRTLRLAYRRPRVRAAAMATQLAGMAALVRRLRRSGWSPDVIHAHVFEAGLPALLLGRSLGRPVVVSEHFTAFQRGLVRGVDLRLARGVFRRADLVCPVSDDLGRQLAAVQPQARLRVVPNVVDTELFHPAAQRRERGPGDPLRLLNVASLDEKKDHAVLLDAVARLRARGVAVTLDIVGEGDLRGALQARAGLLGLERVVRFQGTRLPADVAALMRESDVFVLPSRFENLPVVLLEAMASGLPAVASAVGGVGEIVDAASGALVSPEDPDGLADAIAAIGERLATFDRQALHARAVARYGRDAVGDTWDGIYDDLAKA